MSRKTCPFCGAALLCSEPVAFSIERRPGSYAWYSDGALVASASPLMGLWRLGDARGAHVVTLMPLDEEVGEQMGMALIGPQGQLLGTIRPHADNSEGHVGGSVASNAEGRAVLMMRTDGGQAAHMVDCQGNVVAVASWEDCKAATDLLVTPLGTRHSLAMVFGLLLSLEVSRHAGRIA